MRDRSAGRPLTIGVIGAGAIGSRVAAALQAGAVANAELVAVLTRSHRSALPIVHDIAELMSCDLVVEAAGAAALQQYGPLLLNGGTDLLVVSIGALAGPLAEELYGAGPGRLLLCAGAVGGIDILRAAARGGGLDSVLLTSAKQPASLLQPWMDEDRRRQLATLAAGAPPLEVFRGSPETAARCFPQSLNVAVAVGLACAAMQHMEVVLIADPNTAFTRHTIDASGPLGTYRIELEHRPLADQPRTSAIVPSAVLVSIDDHVNGPGAFPTVS